MGRVESIWIDLRQKRAESKAVGDFWSSPPSLHVSDQPRGCTCFRIVRNLPGEERDSSQFGPRGHFGVMGLLKGMVYKTNKYKFGPFCYSLERADSGMPAQIFIFPPLIMAEPI